VHRTRNASPVLSRKDRAYHRDASRLRACARARPDHRRSRALTLLAYVGAAVLARPDWTSVIKDTLVPTMRFDREFLSLVVAIIGTSLSAYLYTWQSNQEVEEQIAMGRTRLRDRIGATRRELRDSSRDNSLGAKPHEAGSSGIVQGFRRRR